MKNKASIEIIETHIPVYADSIIKEIYGIPLPSEDEHHTGSDNLKKYNSMMNMRGN